MTNRFITEQGFLTAEGKAFVQDNFGKSVDALLDIAKSESDLRLIGSVLANIIGTKIADRIVASKI
jgi:hypothetical protein